MHDHNHPLVVIESTAKPGRYLRFLALAHEGDKRWGKLADADRFIESETNTSAHTMAKRRGLLPAEYKVTRYEDALKA